MQSWWIRAESGKTELELREVPVPRPKPGELLLRVRGSSLNRGELLAPAGPPARGSEARPGGAEAAGEIAALGDGVSGWSPGERVMGRLRGGFAEYAVLDAREAIRVPERLGWEEAGSVPIVFCVVHDMLYSHGALERGEWLLVTGVSSGVGVASLQVAKALGARVIGTSGSGEKLERLAALGLDAAIRTRSADFAARVRDATGSGAQRIVNNVGGSVFVECLRSLAYEGRLATVGYLDGVVRSEIDLEALHANRWVVFGVSNKLRSLDKRAETVRGLTRDLLPAFADGRIRPAIDRVFSLGDLPAAKAYMESNAQLGKIALRVVE